MSLHWTELYFILLTDFCAAPEAILLLVSSTSYYTLRRALLRPYFSLHCFCDVGQGLLSGRMVTGKSLFRPPPPPPPPTGVEILKWRNVLRKTKALLMNETSFLVQVVLSYLHNFLFQVCYATCQLCFDYFGITSSRSAWLLLTKSSKASIALVPLQFILHGVFCKPPLTVELVYFFLFSHLDHVIFVSSASFYNLKLEPLP